MRTGIRKLFASAAPLILASTLAVDAAAQSTSDYAPYVGQTFWGTDCHGSAKNQAPYDYTQRARYPSKLQLTESYHFTPDVENLVAGSSSTDPLRDIDFTLAVWPNHHRALNSAIRARLRKRDTYHITGLTPAECYLQRAINFSPNDAVSHMLYGTLLYRMDRMEEALKEYRRAEDLAPGNIEVQYNLGLLLVDMEQYQEAARYAKRVYARGFPLPGLKRKLTQKGYWGSDSSRDAGETSSQE